MKTQILESYSTQKLKSKENFFTFSLLVVWIGATVAIAASVYRYFAADHFPMVTFIVSLLALVASIPVYLNRKQIKKVLKRR